MNHLDREQFVAAVVRMTYRGDQEEAFAKAWFDLVTTSGSRGLVEALWDRYCEAVLGGTSTQA